LANGRTGDVATTIGKLFIRPGAVRTRPLWFSAAPAAVSMSTKRPCSPAMVLQLWRCIFRDSSSAYMLHRIPLEYFEAALGWLRAQPKLTPSAIRFSAFLAERNSRFFSAQNFRKFMPWWPTREQRRVGCRRRDKATGELFRRGLGRARCSVRTLPLRGFMWRSRYLSLCYGTRDVQNLFRAGLRNRRQSRVRQFPWNESRPVLLISGGDDISGLRRK